MSIHRDDLNFIDSEDLRYLKRLLSVTATQITEHIHTENGWSDVFVGPPPVRWGHTENRRPTDEV